MILLTGMAQGGDYQKRANGASQLPPPVEWQKLVPHPDGHALIAGVAIFASLQILNETLLRASFRVAGEVDALCFPAISPEPTRKDGLWSTTCFEAFLKIPDQPGYVEYNFSPSGDWAVYAFSSYREGMENDKSVALVTVEQSSNPNLLQLTAHVETRHALLKRDQEAAFNLTTVLEHKDGTRSYWALAHPLGSPDFHHDAGFVGRVAACQAI